MTSYNIELGQKIKEARKNRKMTQAQLAEKLSITPQYLGNIENSRANPGVNVLICLANELGMTLDFMLMDQVEDKKSAYEEEILKLVQKYPKNKLDRLYQFIKVFTEMEE